MTNKEGYNYDQFLGDSSDDFPPYSVDDSSQCSQTKINQNDDDWKYKEAYQESSRVAHKGATSISTENLKIALHNVLELAQEHLNSYPKDFGDSDKIILQQSIQITKEHMEKLEEPSVILAKADKK